MPKSTKAETEGKSTRFLLSERERVRRSLHRRSRQRRERTSSEMQISITGGRKAERGTNESTEPDISASSVVYLARANGALVESHRNRNGDLPEGMEMAAFMATFHPTFKTKKEHKEHTRKESL